MITVYLGDVTSYLHNLAKSSDPDAQLIDHTNYKNLKPGTYFTSIADLGNLKNLGTVLYQANTVIYAPPAKWSDEHKGLSAMRQWSEDYLNVYKFRCTVKNYQSPVGFSNIAYLVDQRKTNESQLWVAGCSISYGVGVTSQTRYGQLLSNQLNLPVSFLAQTGSSIAWAADQILRSDVRKNDLVVWGLTAHSRFSKFDKNKFSYINSNTPRIDRETLNFIVSDHVLYQSVTSVLQVINFCSKIQAHLVIASLLDDVIVNYIQTFSNLILLYKLHGRNPDDVFLDLGNDNSHPGPVMHKFYADQIFQKIQEIIA